jgi:hypothetical protein
VVYRQYLHDVVNNNVPQVPLWFKHGLAEIFSSFQADDAVAQVALAGTAADGLGLAGSSRLPVSKVLSLETLPTDGEGMSAFVQGSWALMHYLLVDDEERFEASRRGPAVTDGSATTGQGSRSGPFREPKRPIATCSAGSGSP